MKNLEKKVDLLVALALADHDLERNSLKKDLLELVAEDSFTEGKSVETKPVTVKEEVENLLQEIGVPCWLTGHGRLVTALCMVMEHPWMAHKITSSLYPAVANAVGEGATAASVERNIRHAIEVAWDRGDLEVLHQYFGNTVSLSRGKPTTAEFISQVAHHLRRRLEDR